MKILQIFSYNNAANIKTIPIGLVMSVQPAIDRKTNSVVLTLRPTISKILGYKEIPFYYGNTIDPTVSAAGIAIQKYPNIIMQKIPVVDIREMDSILKLKSGQVVVMGGLMQEQSSNSRRGIPGTKNSFAEFIAGSNEKKTNITELIIFLRATILKNKTHHNADRKMYNTFSTDPRPLRFDNAKTEKK